MMNTMTPVLLSYLVVAPSYAMAVTLQQTTVTTTTTVTQATGITSGGSTFNPFPLLGAAAPLATSPTTINPVPLVGSAPPTPPTGVSIFNPFPLAGAAAPLAAPVQPFTASSNGSSAPRFPSATEGSLRPAAMAEPAMSANTSTTLGASLTVPTQTNISSALSSTPLVVQSTTTTNIPLSLSLIGQTSNGSSLINSVATQSIASSNGRLIQNPEPSTALLLFSGLAGLAWRKRSRAKRTGALI
jgi:hypothetical protein